MKTTMKNHYVRLYSCKVTFWTLLVLTALYSCGSGGSNREIAPESDKLSGQAPGQNNVERVEIPADRKIIKKGDIRFKTADIEKTEAFISTIVNELSGYISSENDDNFNGRMTHRMIIRVPSDKFDQLLSRISGIADKIESKHTEVLDVTAEYIDVEARIKTKKELENRYKDLLARAKNVEEMLAIEKEMGTLRSDIESMEGRFRYLNNQISLSSITVEFYQVTKAPFGFGSKTGQALSAGWTWFLYFIIGLIHFWPFILILGVVFFVVFRLTGKRKK